MMTTGSPRPTDRRSRCHVAPRPTREGRNMPSPHNSRRSTVSSNSEPTDRGRGVVEFDTEDHLGRQRLADVPPSEVPARKTCHASTSSPPRDGRRRHEFGAHRNGCDDRERHRFDGDSRPVFDCLPGELAERCDSDSGCVVRAPQFGSDLDKRRGDRTSAASNNRSRTSYVWPRLATKDPPPLDQFDLDVGEPVRRRSGREVRRTRSSPE